MTIAALQARSAHTPASRCPGSLEGRAGARSFSQGWPGAPLSLCRAPGGAETLSDCWTAGRSPEIPLSKAVETFQCCHLRTPLSEWPSSASLTAHRRRHALAPDRLTRRTFPYPTAASMANLTVADCFRWSWDHRHHYLGPRDPALWRTQ